MYGGASEIIGRALGMAVALLLILAVVFIIASYNLGRRLGYEACLREAADHGVVREVSYNPKDGSEVITWKPVR